jgi:hypothetical protein
MKKIGLLSVIVSATLFGANVNNLDMDQENTIDNTKVNAAIIMQGATEIRGHANVEKLELSNKDRGNVIENTIINGAANLDFDSSEFLDSEYYDRELDDSIVTQGRSRIIDGDVKNVKIDSDNTIDDHSTINAALGNSVAIDQGFTLVEGHGQQLTNTHMTTENRISNVEIEGDSVGSTVVQQGNFLMKDYGAASTADDIRINSASRIEGGKIGHAKIQQSVTELQNGALAEQLDVTQSNLISGETEIKEFSEISQAVVNVDDAKLSSLQQNVHNTITDVYGESSSAVDSKIVQSKVDIQSDSRVAIIQLEHENSIKNGELVDSSIIQDSTLVENNSFVNHFTQQADSFIQNANLDNSRILQNVMRVDNSTLDSMSASTSIQNNVVTRTDLIDSHLSQAMVQIKDSSVIDLTVSEDNTVNNSSVHNACITQGHLIISSL